MDPLHNRAAIRTAAVSIFVLVLFWLCGAIAREDSAEASVPTNKVTIAELHQLVGRNGQTLQSFQIEGVVCAVVPERKLVVLQDRSATVLLRLPTLDGGICVGESVMVRTKNCTLTRTRFGIELGTAPVVDNDGNHPMVLKSGKVFLDSGLQPMRLAWYNGDGALGLKAEYQGPGLKRQKIPPDVLWQAAPRANAHGGFDHGLHFMAYEGSSGPPWPRLPDFEWLRPVLEGTARTIDIMHRTRDRNAGLVFDGFLEIHYPGIYTFYLDSDDGSQLYVGDPSGGCQVLALGCQEHPALTKLDDALVSQLPHQWVELEGVVAFASENGAALDLDVSGGHGEHRQITVVDSSRMPTTNLLHRLVRVAGICEPQLETRKGALVIVPGPAQIEILSPSKAALWDFDNTILTTAEQVMGLKREEAKRGIKARIAGVVTWTSANALVLQDSSAGIYVHFYARDAADQPKVGDLWEIEGKTDPGDFSPVIRAVKGHYLGAGAMPEPIHPTWDQLMNGSLDAQYVEIHGVVTAISEQEMTVLTPDGKLKIKGSAARPIPTRPGTGADALQPGPPSYLDSVVRIRGCLTAQWDPATRRLKAGEVFISPASVSVEDAAPFDPFSVQRRKASDLLSFDARASALQRTRITGQVIYSRNRDYYLLDGQIGVRVLTREVAALKMGDVIEAVGFPQLGGPSPVLQEALVRKTGSARLPEAMAISANELVNGRQEARLVQIEATLVNDSTYRGDRTLELQAGTRHFTARVKAEPGKHASLSPGARVAVTGVAGNASSERAADSLNSFELLVDSIAAVRILREPPWLTPRRALVVATALAGSLIASLVWVTLLRRKVEVRTRQLQTQIEARQIVEQRRVMEEERTRVAQDLHDELGAGLTEVSILGSLAKNPSIPADKKDRYLDQLTEAARSLISELDEIVWAVNPHYDSVASLASYYSLFAQRFLNLAGMACRLEIAERFPEYPLDSKIRHGIFLAFKEALNNVVRHSGATEVELKIQVADDRLLVRISDNGCGLLSQAQAPGQDGIASMRLRLKKLGGECHLSSSPGGGTTVEFRLSVREKDGIVTAGERA